jgi:predicted aldo/keto reductase-like oxidoreductase
MIVNDNVAEGVSKLMIPKLLFGRTGHLSTRTLFGAAAFWSVTQDEADRTMELLMKYGVNHIDTAASYGDSEIRLGPWIEKNRTKVFLASKTGERDYEAAKKEIHQSLKRLRTDHLDLIQLHAVIEDEEMEKALGKGGALQAAIEARDEGLVRFIGITSHTLHAPVIHYNALQRFDFNSVLLPCNYMLMQNPQYRADFKRLEKVCQEKNVAMQMIKTAQRRPYNEGEHTHATWYKPFETPETLRLAIQWALGQPGKFVNTAGDIHILPMILEAASRFEHAPTDAEMDAMLKEQEAAPLWA